MKPCSVSTSFATSSKRLLIAIGVLRPEHCFRKERVQRPPIPDVHPVDIVLELFSSRRAVSRERREPRGESAWPTAREAWLREPFVCEIRKAIVGSVGGQLGLGHGNGNNGGRRHRDLLGEREAALAGLLADRGDRRAGLADD